MMNFKIIHIDLHHFSYGSYNFMACIGKYQFKMGRIKHFGYIYDFNVEIVIYRKYYS